MAKDDYDVIVFRVLVYLYGCLKRVTIFDYWEFDLATQKEKLNEEYFLDVISMMDNEGYITGFKSTRAWGRERIVLSDFSDLKITEKGIHYLKDNDKMKKAKDYLVDKIDVIVSLLKLLFMV